MMALRPSLGVQSNVRGDVLLLALRNAVIQSTSTTTNEIISIISITGQQVLHFFKVANISVTSD